MRWVPDKTRRFRHYPYYSTDELEQKCEDAITAFLNHQYGTITYPISTSDLTVLIEQSVDDLDNGCDLAADIEGLTDFFPRQRPHVKISRRLLNPGMENRLRTTLTHEYGHVILHGFLFNQADGLQRLFNDQPRPIRNQCHRNTMHSSPDWMEWQAGYACGALLMPRTPLVRFARAFREQNNLTFATIATHSPAGTALTDAVAQQFQVSRDAARVRLEQRDITTSDPSPSLF